MIEANSDTTTMVDKATLPAANTAETNRRERLIAALRALTPAQRAESVASMDGPYNPHVLRLTKDFGLRESDGVVRSVEGEIAYQTSKVRTQPCAEQWALMSANVRAEYLNAGFSDPTPEALGEVIAAIVNRGQSEEIRKRIAMEVCIVLRAINDLRAAGYALSADDGGDQIGDQSTNAQLIEHLFGVDESWLIAKKEHKTAEVVFVFGNDGHDVICNYSGSLEEALAGANALADTYAEAQ